MAGWIPRKRVLVFGVLVAAAALAGGLVSADRATRQPATAGARIRNQGILRLAVGGALRQIAEEGGGLVEAIAETVTGRVAHGRFLFTGTAELFEDHGFERVRQVGKHAWILNKVVEPA